MRGGENVFHSRVLEDFLWGLGSDNSGTSRSWNKSDHDGTALSRDLGRDGMWQTDVVTPITSSDRDDRELSRDDGTSDGGGNFLRALDTKTDVAVVISDDDESLKSGSLTGSGLLLDRFDFHDFILQCGRWKEMVNDLILFDWERVEVDFF